MYNIISFLCFNIESFTAQLILYKFPTVSFVTVSSILYRVVVINNSRPPRYGDAEVTDISTSFLSFFVLFLLLH